MNTGDMVMLMNPDLLVVGRIGVIVKASVGFCEHRVRVTNKSGFRYEANYPEKYLVKVQDAVRGDK